MSEGSTNDEELFSLHPEFQNGVEIAKNTITWSQYGYAISEKKFKDGIWRIKIKFDEIPAIAWFGILKCDDNKFDKGNVHDRSGLCVYHSNGFCNQSGFSYGNNPYKSGETVTLEINLTSPAKPPVIPRLSTSIHPFVVSAPSPSYLAYNPPHPFVISAPSPSYLDARAKSSSSLSLSFTSKPSSPTKPIHPFVVSAPSPSYLALHGEQSHPYVVSAPSPSYLVAQPSSYGKSSITKLSLPSSSSYDPSSAPPTYNTLHFYVKDELQPVSYVNIPTPLRFIVYCNYGDSNCQVLGIEPVEKEKSAFYLLQKGGEDSTPPQVADIYDQDEKGYKARVVPWNTNWKRDDR